MLNYYEGWEDDEEEDMEDDDEDFVLFDEDYDDVVMIFTSLMEPGASIKDPSLASPLSFFLQEGGEPVIEEDGLPSKEWLVEALAYYTDHCQIQQAELLYHSRFESTLLMQLWQAGALGKLGTGAGTMN